MFTRKDFESAAHTVRLIPGAPERRAEHDIYAAKFIKSNPRFDATNFRVACNVRALKPKPAYVYVPEPPKTLPEIPTGINFLKIVYKKGPGDTHGDVFMNGDNIGYIYSSWIVDDCRFMANRESKWYPLVSHIYGGGYDAIYRMSLIFKAYSLNSDRTISTDCTGRYLGWIVIRSNGLTTPLEQPKDWMNPHYDKYQNFKLVGRRQTKWGTYIGEDDGIFIKEQGGIFYPQIAVNHASVWKEKRDAVKQAKLAAKELKTKTKVVKLTQFQNAKIQGEPRCIEHEAKARKEELDKALKYINS